MWEMQHHINIILSFVSVQRIGQQITFDVLPSQYPCPLKKTRKTFDNANEFFNLLYVCNIFIRISLKKQYTLHGLALPIEKCVYTFEEGYKRSTKL